MQLTVRDVSAMLAVPEETIQRWLDRESLPVHRVNGEYRFDRTELLEWATLNNRVLSPWLLQASGNLGSVLSRVTLGSVLSAGGVCSVGGQDKRAIFSDLVERLSIPANVDRAMLLEMLVAREEAGSTGVGDGIALPHPRCPMILPVEKASVTLFYLDPSVKFSLRDKQPVHALFVCVAPTLSQHLDLLARLAFVLRDESLRSTLGRLAAQEDVLDQVRRLEARFSPAAKVTAAKVTAAKLGAGGANHGARS